MAAIDWIIVAAYLAFALGVGVVFARRAGADTGEFFISGRRLPWWIVGTSMVATSFASDTPLVITGWVRRHGIHFNWLWWSFAIGGMFSVFCLSRLWRRAEIVTDVELTEIRYSGLSAAALRAFRGAYMAIIVNCITLAWVILAMIKLTGVLLGVPPVWAVAACVVLTTIYATMSGLWGVVVTDVVQFVIAMAGSVVLCVVVVAHFGGVTALAAKATAASPLGEGLLNFFPRPPAGAGPLDGAFWSGPIVAFCVFLFVQWWANKNADAGGVVVQRMSAAKDERHAMLGTLWFNVANYALRPWPWIVVAVASVVVFPDIADGEAAYPAMIKAFLPPGLMGLMVAAFLGAFMSTVDTHLNLSSAYLVNDVYRRFVRPGASERHYVAVSRIACVGFVLLASAIALSADRIADLFVFLLAFTSGIGLVLILRWFWWRINAASELAAMLASGAISIGLYAAKAIVGAERLPWLTSQVILAITVAGSAAAMLIATFATPPVSRERLVAFYRLVRPYGAWGPIPAAAGVAPPKGLRRMLINWLAGSVMVLAATFAVGKFLLGAFAAGWAYAAAAVAAAAVFAPAVLRTAPPPTPKA